VPANLHGANLLRTRRSAKRRDLAVDPEQLHGQPAEAEQRAGAEAEECADAASGDEPAGVNICACAEAERVAKAGVLGCLGADEGGEEFDGCVQHG